ncbi:MAG: hypothetical protein ACTJHC_08240 [Vagococcus sp.]
MGQPKVAGTVILNQEDGHKKFLVKKDVNQVEFIMASIKEPYTSLASILNELKKTVNLNPTDMELVELTNVSVDNEKIPLFVFSLEESTDQKTVDGSRFTWEEPATLREVLQTFQISGVPYFN